MAIIVQKFGGTSLRDANRLKFLLSHVKKSKSLGNDLVVVVSSMGRKGEPYATDTLINKLEEIDINIDPITKDLIMSCGEIISCSVVAHLLDANGIPAIPLTGFQGITSKGQITTLGRGGSDITAVVLGGFLDAERVDIFTDVEGVAVIDPRN